MGRAMKPSENVASQPHRLPAVPGFKEKMRSICAAFKLQKNNVDQPDFCPV
jgi:hypothetical protein